MEDSNSQSTSRNSLISKVRSVITLEPAIFMCTLGYGLQSIISQVSFQKKLKQKCQKPQNPATLT